VTALLAVGEYSTGGGVSHLGDRSRLLTRVGLPAPGETGDRPVAARGRLPSWSRETDSPSPSRSGSRGYDAARNGSNHSPNTAV
jgi:hypothetical protein